MATATTTAPQPTGLKMPDMSAFNGPLTVDDGPTVGTVIGLDLSQWAVAIVDLTDKPDRIEKTRYRYKTKGYAPCEGAATVVGFRSAEVWVIPREQHKQRVRMRREKLYKKVRDGLMADSAVRVPIVDLTGKDGVATPIDRE